MRTFARYPAFAAAGFGATWLGVRAGIPMALAAPAATGVLMLLLATAEWVAPLRVEWCRTDGQIANDLGHAVFGCELGLVLAAGVLALIERGTALWLPKGCRWWPLAWAMPAQLVLGLVAGECGGYWQHRLFHRVPALWRFHALHHSGTRMSFLKTGRFHAVDFAAYIVAVDFPAALTGASPELLAWLGLAINVLGLAQHANVGLPTPRWLDSLVATPAVHRLHHSRERAAGNANFGTNVMLLDHLFGTFRAPTDEAPATVGIEDDRTPDGFLPQLASPLYAWAIESAEGRP